MNYWFDLSSKELYSNSERLNSDVCFFISKVFLSLYIICIEFYHKKGAKRYALPTLLCDNSVKFIQLYRL